MNKLLLKQKLPTILSIAASIGVGITTVAGIRATPKAWALIAEAENKKGSELTKSETALAVSPAYITTMIIGMCTISCIFGANALNRRYQASLIGAYTLLDQTFKEYRNKTKELYSDEADTEIRASICRDKYRQLCDITPEGDRMLFYDGFSERYFDSTVEFVQGAEYHFNRNFQLRGYASVNEFYAFLGQEPIEGGDVLGWSYDAGIDYGYEWIDFDHIKVVMDDGLECYLILMPFEPVMITESENDRTQIANSISPVMKGDESE